MINSEKAGCEKYDILNDGEVRLPEDFQHGKDLYKNCEPAQRGDLNGYISSDYAKPRVREGYMAAAALAAAETMMAEYEGMEKVKEKVRSMLLSAIDKLQYGGNPISICSGTSANYNSIIMGNSGVGKSNLVEKVLYPALKQLGVLTGELVKVSAADLKGKGLNAKKKEAEGGMLFFDEGYAATNCRALTIEIVNGFGKEHGTIMLVVAGYKKEMGEWLNTNQGLQARFKHHFVINDYSAEELVNIGRRFVEENENEGETFELADDAGGALEEAADHVTKISPGTSPANADAIRAILQHAIDSFRTRRQRSRGGDSVALTATDIEAGLKEVKANAGATSGAGSSSGADGFHVPTLRTLTLIQTPNPYPYPYP